MTGEKPKGTSAASATHELDETELVEDLEITDASDADAVRGGDGPTNIGSASSGAGAGKISF